MRLDDAAVTPADAEVVRFLEAQSGHPARSIPFGTELPELIALGAEGCVFGPGDIAHAHTAQEWLALDALERARALLLRFLHTLP